MAWQFSVLLLPLGAASAVAFGLAALARGRSEDLSGLFAALMFGVAVWSVTSLLRYLTPAFGAQVFWDNLGYLGVLIAVPGWFLFSVRYAGLTQWLTRRRALAVFVIPALTVVLTWTNDVHHLMWMEAHQHEFAGLVVLERVPAWWYYVNLGYAYLLVAVGLALLSLTALRSKGLYRRQSTVLVASALVPFGANIAFNVGFSGVPVDLTPFAFAVTGGGMAVALFYLDLLDLTPVARTALTEEMSDPIIVVDAKPVVVDVNPAGMDLLGERLEIGEPPDDALASILDGETSATGESGFLELGEEGRTFRPKTTPLYDHRDTRIGTLVVLDDVTALYEREQRLAVLNRILRHNLRNELTVVLGYLDIVAERHPEDDELHTARTHAEQLAELGDSVRSSLETLDGGNGTAETVELASVAERVADRYRSRWPKADISLDLDPASATVLDDHLIEEAVAQLLENAVEHNDTETPQVSIRTRATAEGATIAVRDDGPEIPAMERDAVLGGTESALAHGSGVGLWTVKWIVDASGGSIDFETVEPRGNLVTLSLPRPEAEPTEDATSDEAVASSEIASLGRDGVEF